MRVTAMMMKMIKGQVIRVSDHSCEKERKSTPQPRLWNSNADEDNQVTHWMSDGGQPILPQKEAQLLEKGHQQRRL